MLATEERTKNAREVDKLETLVTVLGDGPSLESLFYELLGWRDDQE